MSLSHNSDVIKYTTHSPLCCVPHAKQWCSKAGGHSFCIKKAFNTTFRSVNHLPYWKYQTCLNILAIRIISSRKFRFCTFNFCLHALPVGGGQRSLQQGVGNWYSSVKICCCPMKLGMDIVHMSKIQVRKDAKKKDLLVCLRECKTQNYARHTRCADYSKTGRQQSSQTFFVLVFVDRAKKVNRSLFQLKMPVSRKDRVIAGRRLW